MSRRHVLCGLCLTLLAGCAPVPEKGPGGASLKDLEALPSVIVHEPGRQVRLEAAIEAYRALVEARPGAGLRAGALRRLADLQLELAEARLAAGQAGVDGVYRDAVSSYRRWLKAFPDAARADEVLYQLARAYDALGRPQATLAALDRLVKGRPGSRLVPEARFRRGEILFNREAYEDAEAAYRTVVARGATTAFYQQALYKLAWSLLKQGRHRDAVDMFVRGLDVKLAGDDAPRAVSELPRAERELVDDSLRAVALALASMPGAEAVMEFWSGRTRDYEHLVYRALGDLYERRGRLFDASELYRDFVERRPMHAEAPRFHVKLYRLYDRLGFTSLAWDAREDFVGRYRLDGEFWASHARDRYPAVIERLRETMARLAQRSHARWQSESQPGGMATTIERYRDYLRHFPDAPRAPELRFLLAELLYEHGDYARAAQEYERFAYRYPEHGDAADAAYTALLAYEKLRAQGEGAAEGSDWRHRLIESGLSYAARFPHHAEVASVLTKVADELFDLGDTARARRVAARVVRGGLTADADERRSAWTIMGHIDFDRRDYRGAEAAYREALALTPGADAQHAVLSERLAAAIYRQGEQALGRDRIEEGVTHLLRVRTAVPGASIVAKADYDAAAALLRAGRWAQAIEVLRRFRATHRGHELVPEATRKLASAYLQSGRPASAAGEFERMAARESADPEDARTALWRAGELYEQAGQWRAAARAYTRYLSGFDLTLEHALDVRFTLARLAERRGDDARRRYWLNDLIDAERRAGGRRSDASRAAAAEAALALARPLREAYAAIELSVPLERSLARKRRAMERALEAYGRAADFGIARVTTAATYHIGELYHDFSRALLDSDRPEALSAEELMEYNVLLEEQAYPFEERAIELHESNWRRLGQGIYDRWVQESLARLAELLPVRYGKAEKRADVIERIN